MKEDYSRKVIQIAGQDVHFEHPVSELLLFKEMTIVRVETNAEIILNTNGYGFNKLGALEWIIEESPHGTQEDKPYMSIFISKEKKLIASNWNGVDYSVNLQSGKVRAISMNR